MEVALVGAKTNGAFRRKRFYRYRQSLVAGFVFVWVVFVQVVAGWGLERMLEITIIPKRKLAMSKDCRDTGF